MGITIQLFFANEHPYLLRLYYCSADTLQHYILAVGQSDVQCVAKLWQQKCFKQLYKLGHRLQLYSRLHFQHSNRSRNKKIAVQASQLIDRRRSNPPQQCQLVLCLRQCRLFKCVVHASN